MATPKAIDFDLLHNNMVLAIKERFPQLKTVRCYVNRDNKIYSPACYIEMVSADPLPGEDAGTGQLGLSANFEASIVVGLNDKNVNAKIEARKLVLGLAQFIYNNRWDCPIGLAEVGGIYRDDMTPELDYLEIWQVEWSHEIYLSESIWLDTNELPTGVFSWAPDIGFGHEQDYRHIVDGQRTIQGSEIENA